MNTSSKWYDRYVILVHFLVLVSISSFAAAASQGNPNPGVIPNHGPEYGRLGAQWWQWAWSFPFAEIPYYQDGAIDVSAHQSGPVWFLAGAAGGIAPTRSGQVPAGTPLFFPIVNLINDYPCPPEFGFEPDPGETLEQFLVRTGNEALPYFTDLFAEIDGVPLKGLASYRATSRLFTFTADPALAANGIDPCVTGSPQSGVAVGYWLHLPPLAPGRHTLHFGTPSGNQDVFYDLTVTRGTK